MIGENMKDFNLIVARVKSSKKTGAKDESVDLVLSKIEKVFDAINNAGEFDEVISFNGVNITIDDIDVPTELKSLIMPKSVRVIAGDRRSVDVRVRDKVSKLTISYDEYLNAILSLRAFFKREGLGEVTKVGDIRKDVALFDVIFICAAGEACHDEGTVYWPISVDESKVSSLFVEGAAFYNNNASDMKRQFAQMLLF
jgi:hypothetical protein